jgi:hypothetical protein
MTERLAAMWELNSRMAAWRGVNLNERQGKLDCSTHVEELDLLPDEEDDTGFR